MGSMCAAVAMVLTVAGLASARGVSPASEGKTAEQVYKNITALKGTPANELNQSMPNIGHLTIEATLVVGDTPRLLVAMKCPIGALRFWLDRRKTGLD